MLGFEQESDLGKAEFKLNQLWEENILEERQAAWLNIKSRQMGIRRLGFFIVWFGVCVCIVSIVRLCSRFSNETPGLTHFSSFKV